MSGSKKKKQCPYNEWVYCNDESCECCGWYPGGRTKKKRCNQTKQEPTNSKDSSFRRKKQKNNTSGYPGVYWNKPREKWCASIGGKGKTRYLGSFDNIEDAIKARQEAEERQLKKKSGADCTMGM